MASARARFTRWLHTARQLVRLVVGEVDEADERQQLVDDRGSLCRLEVASSRRAFKPQPELDVAPHREPRQEQRLLEHETGVDPASPRPGR